MIFGNRFSKNTQFWCSNPLYNIKQQDGGCMKQQDLTRPGLDPLGGGGGRGGGGGGGGGGRGGAGGRGRQADGGGE
jgi:hypothetical protein